MVTNGLNPYRDKRVLLLQGPMGPFFRRLADDLKNVGAVVYKINFNGGDWLFYPTDALNYRKPLDEWPQFLQQFIIAHRVDAIILFGDCRPIHKAVKHIAVRQNVEVQVFEEGYVRPDYITFEQHGSNGHSKLPRTPDAYRSTPPDIPHPQKIGRDAFWFLVLWTMLYALASFLLSPFYSKYRHHKSMDMSQTIPWLRGVWRYAYYRIKEKGITQKLIEQDKKNYFLIPLQVHNDAQIQVHSDFDTVAAFITNTVTSFANNANQGTYLVFKHHPLDRGHFDYTKLIKKLGREYNLNGRIIYIHDQHLPTLLKHAVGVVVVNSTTGLSALHHNTPLIACGNAIYDMPGLTWQGTLDSFWNNAQYHSIDRTLYKHFRQHLIARTQLNGSFYKRPVKTTRGTGITWESGTGLLSEFDIAPDLAVSSVHNSNVHAAPSLEETV